jgi:GDP-4-dehydro-6-deoxy-D-mannose reductase
LLERGKGGGVYNLCRGAGVELAEVVRLLVARARVPIRIETDPARLRPADVPWLVGDPGRIESECQWRATIELERTLGDVLEEWRAGASPEE